MLSRQLLYIMKLYQIPGPGRAVLKPQPGLLHDYPGSFHVVLSGYMLPVFPVLGETGYGS